MAIKTGPQVRVADEVWIAMALLHRENPNRSDFAIDEIVERARKEAVGGALRPGVYVHVVQHCVANRPPNPGRYRMLFESSKNRRRLFRPGDLFHPDRQGSKTVPETGEIPDEYHDLLEWYRSKYTQCGTDASNADPLLALRGSGKQLWADEHADEYVRRLREGWE